MGKKEKKFQDGKWKSQKETKTKKVLLSVEKMVKENHFLLFRHCVRSTKTDFVVRMDKSQATSTTYSFEELFDIEAKWSVPNNWCTEKGLELVERTGQWLSDKFDAARTQFRFVSDDSHRDIDTALALSRGLQKDNFTGLDLIKRSATLFNTNVCQSAVQKDFLLQEIQKRSKSLSSPTKTTQELKDHLLPLLKKNQGSKNTSEILEDIFSAPVEVVDVSGDDNTDHDAELTGPHDLLKTLGQLLFYSRAAGDSPIAPSIDQVSHIYQFIEYVYLVRSIMNVRNSKAATRGAIMTQFMLQTLNSTIQPDESSIDTTINIVTGHDGDLDAVATALGASWSFPLPYLTGNRTDYLPTPPMTGLHITHNVDLNTIQLCVLYPIYSTIESTSEWVSNITGILEETPLLLENTGDFMMLLNKPGTTEISTVDGSPAISALRKHVEKILRQYDDAAYNCFRSSENIIHNEFFSSITLGTLPETHHEGFSNQFLVAFAVILYTGLMIGLGYFCARRGQSQRSSRAKYAPTFNPSEIELS